MRCISSGIPDNVLYSFNHPYTPRAEIIERLEQDPGLEDFEDNIKVFFCDGDWDPPIYEVSRRYGKSIWDLMQRGEKLTQIIITDSSKPDATKFAEWCMYLLVACHLVVYPCNFLCVESEYITPSIAYSLWERGFEIFYDESNSMGLNSIVAPGLITRGMSLKNDGIGLAFHNDEYDKIRLCNAAMDIHLRFCCCREGLGKLVYEGRQPINYIARLVSLDRCHCRFPEMVSYDYSEEWQDALLEDVILAKKGDEFTEEEVEKCHREIDDILAYIQIWDHVLKHTAFDLQAKNPPTIQMAKEFANASGITKMIEKYDAGTSIDDILHPNKRNKRRRKYSYN
jgi:hypothetical protein